MKNKFCFGRRPALLLLLLCSGLPVAYADGGALTASPTSLNFSDTVIDTQSAPLTVTITRSGEESTTLSAISVSTAQFKISGGTCAVGVALSRRAPSCTVQVRFAPTQVQSATAVLRVATQNRSVTVNLTGKGLPKPGILSVNPTTLQFQKRCSGESGQAPTQTFNVANTGSGPLTGVVVSPTVTGFSINSRCPATLAAGSNCAVSVGFTARQNTIGSVLVTADGGRQTKSVSLTGTCNTPASR